MTRKIFTSIDQVKKEFFPNAHMVEQHKEDESETTKICPHCGKPMVKHIVKEGARFHVTSWSHQPHGALSHCSEPDCENNHGPGHCVPMQKSKGSPKDLLDHFFD